MGLVRVIRGLALAGLVLGGVFVGLYAACVTTAGYAVAQTASSIVVEGNRRVESDTIRSYFRLRPGERLDAAKVDEGIKALIATGLFSDVRPTWSGGRVIITVVENQVISRVAFEGNKRVKDEQLLAGNPVEAARLPVAAGGAVRRAAHRRDLPPQRPLRHPRDAAGHRPAEQPRRPRLRDRRRRQDDDQGYRFRRQSGLFGLAPARRDQDRAVEPAQLPEEQRSV